MRTARGQTCRTWARRTAWRRRGHTLVELAVSMIATGFLLVGMASAVYIATQAAKPDAPTAAMLQGSMTAAEVLSDLRCAIALTERTATSVAFTVADRDTDDAPETIRYAWSGTAGDPLTRQYNAGPVVDVLANVQEFALDYQVKTIEEAQPPEDHESAEILLAGHETAASAADYAIKANVWIGQLIAPALPGDATAWKVTRVRFPARIHGASKGVTAVQLRFASGSAPGSTVLQQVSMPESSLGSSYAWQEFSFSGAGGISPATSLCLVLGVQTVDADLCDVQYDSGGGSDRVTSANAGTSWTYSASTSMLFAVYGTVTTQTTPDPVTRHWVLAMDVTLRTGQDASTATRTGVQLLNAPEVASP
ncbi:MAG: hypothetical protein JXB62_23470 [Pirellulales bacterium]|nr:hypothetical protein [Pirellulales bacterium]